MISKNPQKINTNEFLERIQGLKKLLDSSKYLDRNTRENIAWYCGDQKRQYIERYSNKVCVKIKQ